MGGTTRERGGGAFGGGRGYHMHPGIRTGPLPHPILWYGNGNTPTIKRSTNNNMNLSRVERGISLTKWG